MSDVKLKFVYELAEPFFDLYGMVCAQYGSVEEKGFSKFPNELQFSIGLSVSLFASLQPIFFS